MQIDNPITTSSNDQEIKDTVEIFSTIDSKQNH